MGHRNLESGLGTTWSKSRDESNESSFEQSELEGQTVHYLNSRKLFVMYIINAFV